MGDEKRLVDPLEDDKCSSPFIVAGDILPPPIFLPSVTTKIYIYIYELVRVEEHERKGRLGYVSRLLHSFPTTNWYVKKSMET